MTSELDFTTFTQHEGTSFLLDLAGVKQPLELKLIEVVSIKNQDANRDPSVRQEPFRLTFRGGPVDAFLPQQIFTLKHATMGELEIFLVPIGPDADGMCYEAVFN